MLRSVVGGACVDIGALEFSALDQISATGSNRKRVNDLSFGSPIRTSGHDTIGRGRDLEFNQALRFDPLLEWNLVGHHAPYASIMRWGKRHASSVRA